MLSGSGNYSPRAGATALRDVIILLIIKVDRKDTLHSDVEKTQVASARLSDRHTYLLELEIGTPFT